MDKEIPFTRKIKLEIKRRIAEVKFTVQGHTMENSTEATRWL